MYKFIFLRYKNSNSYITNKKLHKVLGAFFKLAFSFSDNMKTKKFNIAPFIEGSTIY